MDFSTLSITEYVDAIKSKKFKAVDAVAFFVDRCKKDTKNCIREIFPSWIESAKRIDQKIEGGEKIGCLAGVPIIIKDNILYINHGASAGGKMLEKFIAPYSSTVVNKLINEDAIIIARANMDEFALGSSGKKSAYGIVKNARNDNHIAGGTSSGSAVSIACGMCLAAIGTDTGVSFRMPSSYNGVVGIKPTYGRVSRYGVVGAASGLDTIGPLTKSVEDAKIVLDVIAGKDQNDMMTIEHTNFNKTIGIKKLRIGRVRQIMEIYSSSKYFSKLENVFDNLKKSGATIVDIDLDIDNDVISTYYAVNIGQLASNMARFNGIRFGAEAKAETIDELYTNTRTEFFADEVKRRVLFGNHVLSMHKGDSLYRKGRRLQKQIESNFDDAFKLCDAVILPTTYGEACRMDDESENPVKEYANDLFTVPASLAGLPSISVPYAVGENGLPLGIQITANKSCEHKVFEVAKLIEKMGEVQ